MNHGYTYESALAASEKISWRVEDLIGGDKQLDFDRPFLPEALARVEPLAFLSAEEKLTLNHIRGHGYLYLFGLVEEFILPFVIDHTRADLGDDYRVRAMLHFASEEAKHIHLFKRFREDFEVGFGTTCNVIGPPEAIAQAILGHHPLAVALTTLHIEWMTQGHYVESVKNDQELDCQFKSLLKHHWMEEAQHAKLDTLMVEAIAREGSDKDIDTALEDYAAIGTMLDDGLKQQTAFDLDSFQRATRRTLNPEEAVRFLSVQHQAMRWTFLGSGMTHANFLASVDALKPAARAGIEQMAPAFC